MRVPLAVLAAIVLTPAGLSAQPAPTAGTRAAGMSGAFVAVADDASAVYWNPGGLAAGSYFSLLVDRTEGRTGTSEPAAGSRSASIIALAAPAVGLAYYRLRSTVLAPPDLATAGGTLGRNVLRAGEVRLDTLVTHHVGVTLVQSLADGVAVGATLKAVRGTAFSHVVEDFDREALLGDATGSAGRGATKFDTDIGILASSGSLRLGLTVWNATEPRFQTPDGGQTLVLERRARVGLGVMPARGWIAAVDVDLLEHAGPFGPMRDVAVGLEGQLLRRVYGRGGFRANTAGGGGGRAPSGSVGGSYAVRASLLVDAQVTFGSERSARGWGVAGRFVY